MSGSEDATGRVTATPAARDAIDTLRAEYGPLMFVLSHGCCDGTAPMCYRQGDFPLGRRDLLLGTVQHCPFYMDGDRHEAWGEPGFELDVEPGYADGFSLPAGDGAHFVARSLSCRAMDEHVTRWRANIFLAEQDGETTAHAVLETGITAVHGYGKANRNPADFEIEGIGEELAAGRALIALGRRLLGITEEDLEAVEGLPAHVHE